MMEKLEVLVVENDSDLAREIISSLASGKRRAELADDRDGDSDRPIEHVSTLAEAIESLRHRAPDVVLLGLSLPDSEGTDTVDRVRAACEDVPIVIVEDGADSTPTIDAMGGAPEGYLDRTAISTRRMQRCIRVAIERKRWERELERKISELTHLNRVMCHDIRNDLGIVIGRAGELADRLETEARTIDEIVNAANHALNLTRSMDELVDDTVQPGGSTRRIVDVISVLHSEIEKAKRMYQGVSIELESDRDPIHVRADALLASIFANLINNSVAHAEKSGPTVLIDVRTHPDTVVISVTDDGPGLPAAVKEEILTDDGRIESTDSGFGLTLVERMVDRFDGSIRIEDDAPGGTTVVVELPRADGAS